MQYLGGKCRTAKQISAYLESIRGGRPVVEPFCGGLWITSALSGQRYAFDVSRPLITLYKALQDGWEPPDTVSETEYNKLKSVQDPDDPMTAFAGYGCSWGGKFFGGFARDPKSSRNYAAGAKNSLRKKMLACSSVIFEVSDYRSLDVGGCLIYCDPPYADTTGYATGDFDSTEFWDWCRWINGQNDNTVVVSEYAAPSDFVTVVEMPTKTDLGGTRYERMERLFASRSC